MRMLGRMLAIALALGAGGCGESMGSFDAAAGDDASVSLDGATVDGGFDAGRSDAGLSDASVGDAGPVDSGPLDAGAPDAGPIDAGVDAALDAGPPIDAGPVPCPTDLVIAAVDPGGSVAIYNGSASAIDVDSSTYLLHEDPDSAPLRTLEAGVVIPPGGLHRFPYPSVFSDGNASGEMALYRDTALTSPASQIDFVCWGFGHPGTFSVRSVATADGDWSGGCGSSIAGLELRRIRGTDGRSTASYDATGLTPLYQCP